MIGPEILRYPLNQSDANPKPIRTLFLAFFCTSGHLHVFILSPDWFLVIFSFSDWSSRLLWFWFHNTQLKSTLSNIAIKQVHRDFFFLVLDLVQFLLLCFLAFPIKMKTKKNESHSRETSAQKVRCLYEKRLDPVSKVTGILEWYWILGIRCSDTTGVGLVY